MFEDDFKKQHTPHWLRTFCEASGLLGVTYCEELDDALVLYQEMVRHEHEHNIDPFDVQISLEQMEWGRTHDPHKSLFVLTANKLSDDDQTQGDGKHERSSEHNQPRAG